MIFTRSGGMSQRDEKCQHEFSHEINYIIHSTNASYFEEKIYKRPITKNPATTATSNGPNE